jgi:hypothetical protein
VRLPDCPAAAGVQRVVVMSRKSPTPGRVSHSRDPDPHELRIRSARHWLAEAGYCSICNRNERGRRGDRTGVDVRSKGSDVAHWNVAHWICPECALAIAKAAPQKSGTA